MYFIQNDNRRALSIAHIFNLGFKLLGIEKIMSIDKKSFTNSIEQKIEKKGSRLTLVLNALYVDILSMDTVHADMNHINSLCHKKDTPKI